MPEANASECTMETLHRTLGHVNNNTLKKMIKTGSFSGVDRVVDKEYFCHGCQYGKMHQLPYHQSRKNFEALKPEAFVHVPAIQRRKFDAKAHKAILVGYDNHCENYRLYDPQKRRVIVARDVKFKDTAEESSLRIIMTPPVGNQEPPVFIKDENKSSEGDDGTSSEFSPAKHELNSRLGELKDAPTNVESEMEVEPIERTREQSRKRKQDDLDNTLQMSLRDRRH
ncbi:hypothetical protein TKK_0002084 [Trichogramma kaykai]